jgi:hypothetical protein
LPAGIKLITTSERDSLDLHPGVPLNCLFILHGEKILLVEVKFCVENLFE